MPYLLTELEIKHAFESTSGLCIILNPDFSVAGVNETYLKVIKVPKETLLGHNIFEFIPKTSKDKESLKKSLNYVIKHGKEHSTTLSKYHSTSNEQIKNDKIWNLRHIPFYNEQNELTYIIQNVQFELEQLPKQKYSTLNESQTKEIAVYLLDKNGCIATWNSTAENIKGYKADEIIGKPVDIFYTDVDRKKNIPLNNLNQSFKKGLLETDGWRLKKDGTKFFATITITPQIDSNGNIEGYVKIVRPSSTNTTHHQTTKFLSNLARNIKDPVISCDNNYFITEWNNAAETLFGWNSSETKGKTTVELLKPIYQPYRREMMITELLEKGYWQGEATYHTKSGSPIEVLVTISQLVNSEDRITGSFAIIKDITIHKKIALALNKLNSKLEKKVAARTAEIIKSEKLFRALLENSSDSILLLDKNLKYIYRSPAATRISGFTDKELLNESSINKIHPDDIDKLKLNIQEVFNNPRKPISVLFRTQHKKGHYYWIEGIATNLLHEEGIKAIVFNSREVTERILAEEKLIQSEKQFRKRFDNMLEGVQIHDFNWRFVYVNDTIVKHTKFKRKDLIGYTLMDKYPGIEKTELFKKVERCMKERVTERLETEFVHADGKIAHYQISVKPIPEGVFLLSIDITKRKIAEQYLLQTKENLNAIFENSSEGFILTDTEGRIQVFNKKVKKSIFRHTTGEIKIGKSIFDFIEESRKDNFNLVFASVLKGEKVQYDRLFSSGTKQSAWYNLIFTPVKKDNIINGICITGRDITNIKKAEQQKEFNRNNLDALINNTRDLMWSIDLEFKILTSNKAFKQLYGDLTGKSIFKRKKMQSGIVFKNRLLRYIPYFKKAFSGESFTIIEEPETINEPYLEISFNPIYEADKIIGTACFSRDISGSRKIEQELKQIISEKQSLSKRLSSIINTLPANIALLNNKGTIIEVNDCWLNFIECNLFFGKNYTIGKNYIEIAKKINLDENNEGVKIADGINAVLSKKIPEFIFEYSCHLLSEEKWYRMIAIPMQKNDYNGVVLMHIDISELRRLEKERLLNKVEEHKKITQAILSGQEKERNHIGKELHDNISQLLASSKLYISYAAKQNQTTADLLKLPLELIDTSVEEIRLLCKKLVTPQKNIALKPLIEDLLLKITNATSIKTNFIYKVLKTELSADLKLNIYRVLQELVNNMLKYSEAKRFFISVIQQGNCLLISVMDDGIGFDTSISRNGIGISNIISRIESFNGDVKIKSSNGKGTKTTIRISV
jgi:PAS domain S-box-containing protein